MATITFTNSTIQRIKPDAKTAWYSDKAFKGLRLGVTAAGTKTWYAQRWDATANKARQVKLGQFPMIKRDEAWELCCAAKRKMDDGEHLTRKETVEAQPLEDDPLPTLREAFEAYLAFATHPNRKKISGRSPMQSASEKNYRSYFERVFATWADVRIDRLPTRAINQHLNTVQRDLPQAAYNAHTVIRAVMNHATKVHAINLSVPGLTDVTKQTPRKIDRNVPWADRWAEIEAVENPVLRALWELRFHMGVRENTLRALTWTHVDLANGLVTFERLKKSDEPRTIALSDYSLSVFKRLDTARINDWVFPSSRGTGPVYQLDRLPLTAPGDVRHLWNEAAMSVVTPYHIQRWLNQQNLKSDEIAMLGHYGVPDIGSQRDAANKISNYIISRCGSVPNSVVEFRPTGS